MSEFINEELLNNTKSLMQDNFAMMVGYFLEDTTGYIKDIEQGLSDGDLSKINIASHTIKSSSIQVGAEHLSEIARKIEELSKNGSDNIDELKKLSTELQENFTNVNAELKQLL